MRKVIFPPVELVPEELVIVRPPWTTHFILLFPDGDSYKMTPDSARKYLEMLGVESDNRVLDFVQNFHAAHFVPVTGRIHPLALSAVEEAFGVQFRRRIALRGAFRWAS